MGPRDQQQIARAISALELAEAPTALRETLRKSGARTARRAPVLGITGTGGAGKSSLTDELLLRVVRNFPDRNVAVVAMDPTRRRSGGALLGDRIRMNSLAAEQVFMRSLATRRQNLATSAVLADVLELLRCAGFDLIVVETAGIGQSDSEIVDLVDVPLYVMTSEYGAASQLEKIDMLDFADLIVLNKFEKRGAEDALRDVRKQWKRNHTAFQTPDADVPVFPTIASRFNDPGVNRLFAAVCRKLEAKSGEGGRPWTVTDPGPTELVERHALIPASRTRYLAEITANGRRATRGSAASRRGGGPCAQPATRRCERSTIRRCPRRSTVTATRRCADASDPARARLRAAYHDALDAVGTESVDLLRRWPALREIRDRSGVQLRRARSRDPRRELHRDPEPQPRAEARGAEVAGLGRPADVPAQGTPAGSLPVHGGRLPVPARGGGPDADVRGRGRARAHQPALPLPRGRPWRGAPVDGLRLDDAVRRGSGRAPGHLRPHRQLRRLDRHARRHEEALFGLRPVRADDLGLDDDQRTGADDPRDVHEHRGGPACRAAPARSGPLGRGRAEDRGAVPRSRAAALPGRAAGGPRRLGPRAARRHRRPARRSRDLRADPGRSAVAGARHRAGRHPQGGPGAEHLHLLDRVRAAG